MNPLYIKAIAKSFIDLKDSKRLVSFNDFCRNRGYFTRTDYTKIKQEIKNILTNRRQSFSKGMIQAGVAHSTPAPLLSGEQNGKRVDQNLSKFNQ